MNNMERGERSPLGEVARFYILALLLSWPPMTLGGVRARAGEDAWLPNAAAMVAVGVAYLLYTRLLGRPDPGGPLMADWRALVAGVAVPLMLFLYASLEHGMLGPALISWGLIMVAMDSVPALCEELAWRRYTTGLLFKQWGPGVKSFLASGLLWGVWHSPLLLATGGLLGLFVGILLGGLHGVWIAFLYKWGGLATSTAYHALFVGLRDTITATTGDPGAAGVFALSSLLGLGVLLGLVVSRRH